MVILVPKTTMSFDKGSGPAWAKVDQEIYVRCQCGNWLGLGCHEIAQDGTVSPSLWHSKAEMGGCDWHVFIKLKEYNG